MIMKRFAKIKEKPNRTELEMFGVMWSEIVVIEIQNLYYQSFRLKEKMCLLGLEKNW